MLGKAPNQHQFDVFKATLKQIIDPNHPLVSLAHAIPCKNLEDKFEHLYSHTRAPSHHSTKWRGGLKPRSKEQMASRSTGNRKSPYISCINRFFLTRIHELQLFMCEL